METRRVRRHKTTAVFLACALLLLGGTAVASAAQDLFLGRGLIDGPSERHSDNAAAGELVTLTIPVGGLAPGASSRGQEVVENATDGPLRYALSSSTADHDGTGLRDVVRVTIKTSDRSVRDEAGAAASCVTFDGETLYAGRLGAAAAGFGDPRVGGNAGDRHLAAGKRETLCFEIEMPLDAGNEFQGSSTASVWTLAMEQVAGNP
jgi:hypothetical protein